MVVQKMQIHTVPELTTLSRPAIIRNEKIVITFTPTGMPITEKYLAPGETKDITFKTFDSNVPIPTPPHAKTRNASHELLAFASHLKHCARI